MMEAPQKRIRKSESQLLEEAVVRLYERIEEKIKTLKTTQEDLDEIFQVLRPLRALEDEYRGKNERSEQ